MCPKKRNQPNAMASDRLNGLCVYVVWARGSRPNAPGVAQVERPSQRVHTLLDVFHFNQRSSGRPNTPCPTARVFQKLGPGRPPRAPQTPLPVDVGRPIAVGLPWIDAGPRAPPGIASKFPSKYPDLDPSFLPTSHTTQAHRPASQPWCRRRRVGLPRPRASHPRRASTQRGRLLPMTCG